MKKIKLGKRYLVLSILTLITVITWIGFEVYWVSIRTTIPKVTQEQMATLNPKINRGVIEKIKESLAFSEEEFTLIDFSSLISTESASPE
jgi:AICAR transformylase/IMP cyclohydrolase PurH